MGRVGTASMDVIAELQQRSERLVTSAALILKHKTSQFVLLYH